MADYPAGVLAASMILPGSTEPILLVSSQDGGTLTIPVTRAMTAKRGNGNMNIRLIDADDVEKRSAVVGTVVHYSHAADAEQAPDAAEDWMSRAAALLAELEGLQLPQTLSFNKTTCVLSISDGNNVELNRGLNEAQYAHLTDIMARPYGTWTLNTGPVYSQTHPSRDVPGRKSCRVEWGLGIIHLDFVAALASGEIGTIPATGPKAEILMEDQLHDGATIWIDQGTRTIKAQGLQAGQRYLFNIVGFFIH
jgi:hypothetical protein